MRAAVLAVPLALVLVAGCGGDDDDATPTTTASTTSTTSSTTTTSTTTTTTTVPTTAVPTTTADPDTGVRFPDNPSDYTSDLVRAWGRGDRERALELAVVDVVDTLFGYRDPGGTEWDLDGCEGAAGTSYCEFTDAETGETLTLTVPNATDPYGKPQAVSGVTLPD